MRRAAVGLHETEKVGQRGVGVDIGQAGVVEGGELVPSRATRCTSASWPTRWPTFKTTYSKS